MSVKDQILQLVIKFKKENYLKDKTDAMGEGLLLGASLADDANELSKETGDSFKRLQQEYTENGNGAQSTAELITARDGEQVINDRLNRDFGNINFQLTQMVKSSSVKLLGAVGDGVTNDTVAIQAAIDENLNLYFPPGVYLIDNLVINRSNTKIVFDSGVYIKTNKPNCFLITGEFVGAINAVVRDAAENDSSIFVDQNKSNEYTPGDWIYIKQDSADANLYNREVSKIKSVNYSTGQITLEYALPHTFVTADYADIQKFIPVQNVALIGDNTTIDQMGSLDFGDLVKVDLALNFRVFGLKLVNGASIGLSINRSRFFEVCNVTHQRPTSITEGKGYGVSVSEGSSFGIVKNSTFIGDRHGVDFAMGAHDVIVDYCLFDRSNVNGHGQHTKNMKVRNSKVYYGYIGMGNNTYSYDYNYEIDNCEIYFSPSEATYATNGSFNFKIKDTYIYKSLTAIVLKGTKYVDIINVRIVDTTGTILNMINAEHVYVDNVRMQQNQVNGTLGVNLTGCKFIEINNVSQIGNISTGLKTFDLNVDISISNSTLTGSVGSHALYSLHTQNLIISNNHINGSLVSYDDATTDSRMQIITGNIIKGNVDIRTIINLIFKDNITYGKYLTLPANNDVDKIVKDNILVPAA